MSYRILPLVYAGAATQSFDLGLISINILPRFNYHLSCWSVDILDANDEYLAVGLMAVPGIDILSNLPELKLRVGSLVFVENKIDDYMIPESLGFDLQLFWYPPGEPVELFRLEPSVGP